MNPDPARAAPLSPVAPPSAGAPLSPDVTPPPLPPLGPAGPAQAARLRPIRTYVPRFRTTARTRGRLDALLPRYGVRALPLVPAEAFGRVAPLVVEIGSGYGEAALGYAAAHPEHDVLAAEIHLPGVATMLAAADAAAINNLRVYPDDGLNLLNGGLPAGAAHAIHLFFPDPWPKSKHAKRRLVQRHTLVALARLLAPGGRLLVASDHPTYAAHVRAQFAGHAGFVVVEIERPSWKSLDGFEAKGLAAGRAITYLAATPR